MPVTRSNKRSRSNNEVIEEIMQGVHGFDNILPLRFRSDGLKITLSRKDIRRRGSAPAMTFDSSLVSTPHCEIFVENGKNWVKDINSASGTFLNGIKLFPGLRSEILVGDTISLGWSPLKMDSAVLKDNFRNARDRKYFIVKIKEQLRRKLNLVEETQSICTGHLNNSPFPEEIVAEICKYLPTESVGNARMVCRSWNSALKPLFQKRAELKLSCSWIHGQLFRNSQYMKEITNFHYQNVKLKFDYHYSYCANQQDLILPPNYRENLGFFTLQHQPARKICVKGTLQQPWKLTLLEKFLDNSSSTLDQIEWKIRFLPDPFPTVFLEGLRFPLMKKFTLGYCKEICYGDMYDNKVQFFKAVFLACPNLEALLLATDYLTTAVFEIFRSVSTPRSLTSLEIYRSKNAVGDRFGQSGYQLNKVLMFPNPLRKFSIRNLGWEKEWGEEELDILVVLYQLLYKHSETLEELELEFVFQIRRITLKLPKLPSLKKLWLEMYGNFDIKFAIANEDSVDVFGGIDYVTHLPQLESLVVKYDPGFYPAFVPFLPGDDAQTCNTCKVIELYVGWRNQAVLAQGKDIQNDLKRRLLYTFPVASGHYFMSNIKKSLGEVEVLGISFS